MIGVDVLVVGKATVYALKAVYLMVLIYKKAAVK